MTFSLFIFWILVITSFTVLGSWHARKYNSPDLLIGLYVTFVLVAQILAAKIAAFDLGFKTFYGPAGVVVFSITYLLTDIVNEKFGRKMTQKMILIALVSQIAAVAFFWMGTNFAPAPFWQLQGPWSQIFGFVPRVTLASWIAFFISENFDAQMFFLFRKLTHGRHLWMRNAFSSIPALLLDSLIFIPIAFGGMLPLVPLIIGQTAVKWLAGVIGIPFIYVNKAVLGSATRTE